MIHDSTWLARTRARRRRRSTAPIGFLLACVLLAGLPAAASASAPEMRGEWELVVSSTGQPPVKGTALIRTEANINGEFAASSTLFEHTFRGTFSGTLEGSKASVEVTTEATGPVPALKFTSTTMTVESNGGSLSMSGVGTLISGTTSVPNVSLVATRIKTYKEVEEREAREAKEQQEREARENIRGEWSLSIKVGPQTSNGTALIKVEANAKNEFASSSTLFESVVPGSFSGTLEGSKATVTVTTEAYGQLPANEFTSNTMTVESKGSSLLISGTGKLYSNKILLTESATLVATRIRTYAEVTAREAKEKAEREAKEREAKEKAEHETKEREAKEMAEREAKEKQEREKREAAEKAAVIKTPPSSNVSVPGLVSVQLTGKNFTVGAGELLSLQVTNPNPYAISGRVTLLAQSGQAGKSSTPRGGASKKSRSLGTVSFGISPDGKRLVKLKLSQGGRAELARHKTLHVLATVVTEASGQTTATKTFSLTLHAGKKAQGKH